MSFNKLHPEIIKAIKALNYHKPTPIQDAVIERILSNQDILASAQTGTGKTAAFMLPTLHKIATNKHARSDKPKALVIAPTKELVTQIYENTLAYSLYLNLTTVSLSGGSKIEPQIAILQKPVDIIITTPSRILELVKLKATSLKEIDTLILDEADRLLDMGFMADIETIHNAARSKRNTLMFSVTFTKAIKKLARSILVNPAEINLSINRVAKSNIVQKLHPVDCHKKLELLSYVIGSRNIQNVIVFVETKAMVSTIEKHLKLDGLASESIFGDKTKAARAKALERFKSKKSPILVATDIASRGIDIEDLAYVINFDIPNNVEDYVHRIGRCGRADRNGEAITLVCEDEYDRLQRVERFIKMNIPREIVNDFEPTHKQKAKTAQKKMKHQAQKRTTSKAKSTHNKHRKVTKRS